MVSMLQKQRAVARFQLFHSEETEVNALASDTVWMFTWVIQEDMGQIIEQCAFEERKQKQNQPVTLYFAKPKVGLCFLLLLQHTGELIPEQDPSSLSRKRTAEKQIYNLQYGNKVCLLAMLLCDRCY